MINVKWVALTDLSVKVSRNARQGTLVKAWTAEGIQAKWDATTWAKKIAGKAAAAKSTDFGRFTAKVAKQAEMKKVMKAM